ncbi:MAG: InlB B-repeat-containing protein [Clostridia bacterium]|nr:InlB B-repeat-containing protein [Clostridia bacterium]
MKIKSLICILAVAICLSACALGFVSGGIDLESSRLDVLAESGLSTRASIYIRNSSDWNLLASDVASGNDMSGVSVVLDADISISAVVGDRDNPFRGSLDGRGHTLIVDISGSDYCAPIGCLSEGSVTAVGVEGKIVGKQAVGGVVGYNYKGNIYSCSYRGDIVADNYAGGIVGVSNGGVVDSCYAFADITVAGTDTFAGGIAGVNEYDGIVARSYYVGKVSCVGGGGVAGYAGRGNLTSCYYNKDMTDRARGAASEAVISDVFGLSGMAMSGDNMRLGDAFTYRSTGGNWGCYPALKSFDITSSSDYNQYANWSSHLINCKLLIKIEGDAITISALDASAPLGMGSRRGYNFLGWYTQSEGGDKVESVSGDADAVIYGRYEIVTYTITYELAGGMWSSGYKAVSTYTVLDELALPTADDVYMSDSKFSGWRTEGGEVITSIAKGSVGDIVLTADFSLKPIAAMSRFVTDYIWIILDIAGALLIVAEIAVLLRVRKKKSESGSYSMSAALPLFTSALFYPAGLVIFIVEIAIMIILPIAMLARRGRRRSEAEALAACDELFIELMPPRPLLLGDGGIAEAEDKDLGAEISVTYRNSFTARLIMSSEQTKKYYCAIKARLLAYRRVHARVSWSCETFGYGRSAIAKIAVSGNVIKLYLALDFAGVESKYFATDKSGVKKYESVPTCVKVKSDRALKRALTLIGRAADNHNLVMRDDGEAKVVFDNVAISRDEMIDLGFVKSKVNFRR